MTALPPKKKLVKSTALAKTQSTLVRLNALLPTTTTVLSPTTVYQPGASSVGNELAAPTTSLPNISGWFGSWTAPDLNNGSPYQVQVECFGPGGGGGGGIAAAGGGGGGGGEYACEPTYTVSPGVVYTYQVGLPGTGGANNSSATGAQEGTAGTQTIFDLAGLGIPGGVVANPGLPGDAGSTGVGGLGGTGSTNTMAFAGGPGGTNGSGQGSDNPLALSLTSGYFVGNPLNDSIVQCWYIMNDGPDNTFEFNDSSTHHHTGTVTTSGNGIKILQSNAPAQVPAYTMVDADPPDYPNPTRAGCSSLWNGTANNTYAGYVQCPNFFFQNTQETVSCWLQCSPQGTWGSTAANAVGTVVANSANYATFGPFNGHGLFLYNTGSVSNPNWYIYWNIGDNTIANFVRFPLAPVIGTWYYVVGTFNSGAMTLYVNGTSVATASLGASSIPAASYNQRIGTDPTGTTNYFFGYISNLWIATGVMTAAGVTAAFGTTAPTGGAGGGASGSAGGVGGGGNNASAGLGGSGGTVVALPPQYASIRAGGNGGAVGANAGASGSSLTSLGSGGGGGGNMAGSPASVTMTIPFATAATYCGTDASSPGALYNASQSGGNSLIVTGGISSDTSSGSKNTLVLLPPGIAKSLGNGKWTIQQISLTLTNSLLSSADTVLEFAYTADTTLPANYTGADAVEYVGAVPLDAGENTVTYDLTQSNLGTLIQSGAATALCFGPTDNPTFDAYNATTGAQFYCQIYGPGAVDNFGNSLQPYLTIVLQETLTTQHGGRGGSGGIKLTSLTDATTPIGIIQPFAGNDDAGNQYASGYTGQINAYNPSVTTPGSYVVETWNNFTGFSQTGWTQSLGRYKFKSDNTIHIQFNYNITTAATTHGTILLFTLPSAWWPVTNFVGGALGIFTNQGTYSTGLLDMRLQVTTAGQIEILAFPGGDSAGGAITSLNGHYVVPLD